MKAVIHRAGSRGHANHGWLDTHHTFSFARFYDPERMNFGLLRVLNDDIVQPGMGFGTHPHDNMEIVSIPLVGELAHKDSTGHEKVIRVNDVQIMSAGTGVTHSEYNYSREEPVNFLQIWVFPKEKDIKPRYEQKQFEPTGRINKLQLLVSPDKANGSMWINQDAWFSLADIQKDVSLRYSMHASETGLYLFVISGSVEAGGETLNQRDGIGIYDLQVLDVNAISDCRLLFIEIPMS